MSMTPAAGPTGSFMVVSQIPSRGKDASGAYVGGHLITASVPSGSTFQVFVPDTAYTVENVKAALGAKAAQVIAVDQLSG